ncbi:MAG: hypothetical protein FWF56_06290 [Firmicutes bacterium]|nr:hypothetical protein [Bacillota bacterium]MCL1953423.1 hypothetical protein [Bacillota bacterium]
MSIVLHFEASFEAVYSVNGIFLESANKIKYQDNQAIYVTVFPLKAQLLPYTVKLIGGKVVTNKELCDSFALPLDNYFVKLHPRHNYVYSPQTRRTDISTDIVEQFYNYIKKGNLTMARTMMTEDLNKCIEDDGMTAFFAEFVELIKNNFFDDLPNSGYFLITKDGQNAFYIFDIVDGLIDNIRQHAVGDIEHE